MDYWSLGYIHYYTLLTIPISYYPLLWKVIYFYGYYLLLISIKNYGGGGYFSWWTFGWQAFGSIVTSHSSTKVGVQVCDSVHRRKGHCSLSTWEPLTNSRSILRVELLRWPSCPLQGKSKTLQWLIDAFEKETNSRTDRGGKSGSGQPHGPLK